MENQNNKEKGVLIKTLLGVMLIVFVALWAVAAFLGPAALVKLCWAYLLV